MAFLVTANGLAKRQMQLLPAITTVAGNGVSGYGGDGSAATSALLNGQTRVAVDSLGNLYIADTGNNVVREVLFSNGVISTIAGILPSQGGCRAERRQKPQEDELQYATRSHGHLSLILSISG
jgi:hypothetical protein